jgi:hypothetical protein
MTSAENKFIAMLLRLMRNSAAGAQHTTAAIPAERPATVRQREAQFTDFEAVAGLQQRWGLPKNSAENWYRIWRDNAAFDLAKSPLSIGSVLETEKNLVGYQGSIPLLYHYGDRRLLAATGTGLVVEPAYRARTIGLMASFYRQKNIDLFLMTTAVEAVGRLSRALRAEALPQRDYDTVLFWVLNPRDFANAVVEKFGADGPIGNLAAFLGSLAVRSEMTARRRGPRRIRRKFQVTEIPVHEIGDDFAALWQTKLAERPRLLADRTPASLRWHFIVPESQRKTMVLCCRMRGHLAGYAVVQNAIDDTGLHRCALVDLLVEADDSEVTENLLAAAYAYARTSGGHVFEVLGFPGNVRRILRRWRPYSRKYPACPFYYKAADRTLQAILSDQGNWYATPFDGDTTLMP